MFFAFLDVLLFLVFLIFYRRIITIGNCIINIVYDRLYGIINIEDDTINVDHCMINVIIISFQIQQN